MVEDACAQKFDYFSTVCLPGVQTRQGHTRRAALSTALDRLDRLAAPLVLLEPAPATTRGSSPGVAAQVSALAAAMQDEVLPAHSAAAEATQLEGALRGALRGYMEKKGGHDVHDVGVMALADAVLWRTKGLELLVSLCGQASTTLLQLGAVDELFENNLRGEGGGVGQRLLVMLVRGLVVRCER